MSIINIFLVGEISSGKSSFINALAGGLIANCSLQRETFNPITYHFNEAGTVSNINKISETLEEIHRHNEEKRRDQSTLKIADFNNPIDMYDALPMPHMFETNFDNVNIIDFPGINDVCEDKNNKFVDIIKKNISKCDLLIFVTDASRAFISSSEANRFKKIKSLVEGENSLGHYIELIVVVNKFDDFADKDLQEIYESISLNIGIPKSNIFRISSHKLFIDRVISSKRCLAIPQFFHNEIDKIFQHANVIITGGLKNNIINNNLLSYELVNYSESITINMTGSSLVRRSGDYDNLVRKLNQFTVSLVQKRTSSIIKAISENFPNENLQDEQIQSSLSFLKHLFDKISLWGIDFDGEIKTCFNHITNSWIEKGSGLIITFLIYWAKTDYGNKMMKKFFAEIFNKIFKNPSGNMPIKARALIFLTYIKYSLINVQFKELVPVLFSILRNDFIWNNWKPRYYDMHFGETVLFFDENIRSDLVSEPGEGKSSYIKELFNHADNNTKYLLQLAHVNVVMLKTYLDIGFIDINMITEIADTAEINLRILVDIYHQNFVRHDLPKDHPDIEIAPADHPLALSDSREFKYLGRYLFSIDLPINPAYASALSQLQNLRSN